MKLTLSDLLGPTIIYGLSDKSIETRVATGKELELTLVSRYKQDNESFHMWINECICAIESELIMSAYQQCRNGGLLALASISLGLRDHLTNDSLKDVLSISIKMIDDEENRVRYYACETVFNILNAGRTRCLDCFDVMFSALCKLSGDADLEIRQTAPIFDRLLKEVVIESYNKPNSPMKLIISSIESFLMFPNPYVKQLCLGWLGLFLKYPNCGIIERIPNILPPLFALLSDELSNSPAKRDLANQAEYNMDLMLQLFRDSQSDLLKRMVDPTLSVLIKYGTFQATLNDRSRKCLFDWIRVLGPMSARNEHVHSLVVILVSSVQDDSNNTDMILKANEELLNSRAFKAAILQNPQNLATALETSLIETCKLPVEARERTTSVVVGWIDILAQNVRFRNMGLFIELELNTKVLKIIELQFGLQMLVKNLLEAKKLSAKNLEVFLVAMQERIKEVVVILTNNMTSTEYSSLLFEMVRFLINTSPAVLIDVDLITPLISKWRSVCPIAAILACLVSKQYESANDISVSIGNDGSFDQKKIETLIELLESDTFMTQRLELVSGRSESVFLVKCLVRLCLLMNQESSGFKILFNRLQLVNLFKLL
jgi:hypothetical protein